jgi:hypothetical protein
MENWLKPEPFFPPTTTSRATQYKIRICVPGSAIEPNAIRIHNPTPPSTDARLNLNEKTSAEKLLPIRRCVKAQRFSFPHLLP